MGILADMLTGIEKLIAERGSAAVLKERIDLLRDQLQSLVISEATAKSEAEELRKQVAQLQTKLGALQPAGELVFRDGHYYGPDGAGPFCPGCWDDKRKRIRLMEQTGAFATFGRYHCPACGNSFS